MTTTTAMPELPDAAVLAAARELCKIHAGQCGVDYDDTWAIYSEQFKADARACLEAAAPALATLQAQAQPAAVSDAEIDAHLDVILRASGSALRHYTMAKTKADMRAALRSAILALRPQAVPMTEAWLDDAMRLADAYADASFDQGLNQRIEDPNPEAKREKLAEHLHGITAQAKEGGA